MPLRVHMAEEIRALMARRRISGVALASRINRSQSYVSRRLTGEVPFDVDDLEAIAVVLGVTAAKLVGSAGEGTRQPTVEYFDQTVRPSDTRPKGGPRSQSRIGPPNGASPVRHSRHRGTPLAVANPSRMA